MKQVTVTNVAAKVANAGPRRFVHIQNASAQVIYVKYDGDAAALTTANGMQIQPGETWQLNNDPGRFIFDQDIWLITSAGTADVRIQGES